RDREQEAAEAGERPPRREWLVTNGLGGYSCGTVAGVITRRYHGLLVAALPAPLGRYVMLNHLLERVRLPNRQVVWLGDEDEVAVDESIPQAYSVTATANRYEVSAGPNLPRLRMTLNGDRATLTLDERGAPHVPYKMEESRGYRWIGSLWSPGYFRAELST